MSGTVSLKKENLAKISPIRLIRAVAINPKTGRLFRKPEKKDVIYGYVLPDGRIIPMDMEPQRFAKIDYKQLGQVVKSNKLTSPPDITFFVKKTNRLERYKGGERIIERKWDSDQDKYIKKTTKAKKGQIKYIYRDGQKSHKARSLKVVFKPPSHRMEKGKRAPPVYRKVAMKFKRKKYKSFTTDWRMQERSRFERLQDQMLAVVTKLKKKELEGAKEGYKSKPIILRGDTLAATISTLRPPHSFEALKKKKITAIAMDAIVHFKDEKEWKSFSLDLPGVDLTQYSDLNNMLSREIRKELLSRGKTFTKLATFDKIRTAIKARAKRTQEPYFPMWRKVGRVMSGGKWHDISSAITKMRSGKSPYQEIKRGNLKVEVTFRYYSMED